MLSGVTSRWMNPSAWTGGQRPQHRDHHVEGLLHADLPAVVGDVGLEGDALDVVHDEIRRVVLVEIAGDRRNVRIADELRQGPGFLLEPFGTVGELLGLGVHGHGHRCPDAGGDVVGMNSLMATLAFSWVSKARYVIPNPPWPSTRPTMYRSFRTVPARRAPGIFSHSPPGRSRSRGQGPSLVSRS